MASQTEIAQRVVESILGQKLKPGERLGEQDLADLFGVSRTLVREALMQLQARGFVEVRTRKGWYVVEPSVDEARDAFAARRAVEAGMLRDADALGKGRPLQSVLRKLRRHIQDEQAAITGTDVATRAFLLADFHVCLAECLGHKLLSNMLRDLTARTMLAATLYQSTHDAEQSCAEHAEIVNALERGERERAAGLMLAHIGSVEDALGQATGSQGDARERLRATLAPLARAGRALP
jgi:DNA-binding GntR family transcriptional regulator